MHTKLLRVIGTGTIAAALAVAMPVFAEKADTTKLNLGIRAEGAGSTTVTAKVDVKRMTLAKERGDREIDRRVEGLDRLIVQVQGMKHISDSNKTSIVASITAQKTALTTLKAKIDADADLVTLKEDIKAVTQSYRIYALVIPQGEIIAAADRIISVLDAMSPLALKLQTAITAAKTAGKDITTLQSLFSDLTAKASDAQVQAQAAISAVASLTPDNGDTAKAEANRKALLAARGDIKAGNADLKAARQDITKITKGLKDNKIEVNGTTTAETR